jgi:hypothetical protein
VARRWNRAWGAVEQDHEGEDRSVTVYLSITYTARNRTGWSRDYRDGKLQRLSHRDEKGYERRYELNDGTWTLSELDPDGHVLSGPTAVTLTPDQLRQTT